MFSMDQARYSTVIFLHAFCKFAISTTANSIENFPKTCHERSPLHPQKASTHTPEVYRKKSYTGTGSLRIRNTYGGSWLLHPIQVSLNIVSRRQQYKETFGLRIYHFAYMNSPPLFQVPSILRSCYSNYELKTRNSESCGSGNLSQSWNLKIWIKNLKLNLKLLDLRCQFINMLIKHIH